MCLTINKQDINSDEEIKTATEDIVCWKLLSNNNVSEFQGFYYELGKKYSLGFELCIEEDRCGTYLVHKGFHSWKNPPYYNSCRKLVKCIIPKGSEYIEGIQYDDAEGYVSDSIIVCKSSLLDSVKGWFKRNIIIW